MADILRRLLNRLSNYIIEYKVLSGDELMGKISEEIGILDEQEQRELQDLLESDAKHKIFHGIIGEETGLSVFCPDLHVKINYLGEIFFCPPTHKYMQAELHKGFLRIAEQRGQSLLGEVEEVLSHFLRQLEYRISPQEGQLAGSYKELIAHKDQYHLRLYLFFSIVTAQEFLDNIPKKDEEQVIIVPSERTPAPFIKFIRESEDKARDKGLSVWVVDIENRAINPFLGVPVDREIWAHFTDPEASLRAIQMWRSSGPFSPSDGDF